MSVPFGPIGAICLQRIVQRGMWAGLASGFGLALGDSFFAALAVFGIAQLTDLLLKYQVQLELAAGLLILLSALHSYAKPKLLIERNRTGDALRDVTSMFFITIANPQTIIGFSMAIAGAVRFYRMETAADAVVLVLGIFSGAMLWWVGLNLLLERLRRQSGWEPTARLHQIFTLLVGAIGLGLIIHALVSV